MQTSDGVGISCQLWEAPKGSTVVLLHALGEQASSWDSVVPPFASVFPVLAISMRGHGDSDWPGVYSFELMRDDVLAVLDHFDLRDVILIGHSMGGIVAYLMAQAQPSRIAHLVVEDASPPFPRARAVPERPMGTLPFDWAVVPAIVEQVNDPTRRWWQNLPDIAAPTLLIGGGPHSHLPQDLLIEVAQLIPNSTLVTIEVGHNIHEAEPAMFSSTVLTWLDTHDGFVVRPRCR